MSLTIVSAKNPVYTSSNKDSIQLLVKFAEFPQEIQFNAMPTDSEAHGVELYNRAKAGEFGEIAEYVLPPQPKINGIQVS